VQGGDEPKWGVPSFLDSSLEAAALKPQGTGDPPSGDVSGRSLGSFLGSSLGGGSGAGHGPRGGRHTEGIPQEPQGAGNPLPGESTRLSLPFPQSSPFSAPCWTSSWFLSSSWGRPRSPEHCLQALVPWEWRPHRCTQDPSWGGHCTRELGPEGNTTLLDDLWLPAEHHLSEPQLPDKQPAGERGFETSGEGGRSL